MLELLTRDVAGHEVRVVASERTDGDMHPERVDPAVLALRQRALAGRTWPMLDQAHGVEIVEADRAPADADPLVGDIAVSRAGAGPVAVWAADCAPVVLVGTDATIVVAHAGWRGLSLGVLDRAVARLTDHDEGVAAAVLGPAIHPCCYEFGDAERRLVEAAVGVAPDSLLATTGWGTRALDVPGAVRAGLARHGVDLDVSGPCTGCDSRFFSHRRRSEPGRHAVVAWAGCAPTRSSP